MHHNAGPIFAALAAATSLGVACAADPGDPQKSTNDLTGGSSSSGGFGMPTSSSSSGSPLSSSSSSGAGTSSGFGGTSSSSGSVGSSSSTASSGSGSGSGPDAGQVAGPTCITNPVSSAPVISYYTTDTMNLSASQQMGFNFEIVGGLGNVALSDLTVRYWFTVDANSVSSLFFISYYSQTNNNNITADITATFAPAPAGNVTPTSDSYMELSFAAGAGSLAFGANAQIQVVVHGPGSNGYSDVFNETNDYSFDATKTQTGGYQPFNRLTVYDKGVLVFGCEPSGTGGGAGSSSSGAAGSSSSGAASSSSGAGTDSGTGAAASDASAPGDAAAD